MKQILLCTVLGISLYSCTEHVEETLAETQDAFVTKVATSVEYHNYQSMLVETMRVMEETHIDYDAIKALMEETGRHFKEMAEEEFAHIEGAHTLRWVHNRTAETITPMKELFPNYRELSSDIRIAILNEYHENKGMHATDMLLVNAQNAVAK